MTWTLHIASRAEKRLKRIPSQDQQRIRAALEAMRNDPFQGNLVYLKNDPRAAWRRRVGSYRIFFDVVHERLLVGEFVVQPRAATVGEGERLTCSLACAITEWWRTWQASAWRSQRPSVYTP